MAIDPFNPHETWKIPLPYYLRKIDAKWHVGSPEDEQAMRIKTILENVLVPEDGRISIYLVRNRTDLRRVVVALAANRGGSGSGPIRFVAISAHELQPLRLDSALGFTKCRAVNKLHKDILARDPTALRTLAEAMARAGRRDRNFSKTAVESGRQIATQESCNAIAESRGCACDCRLDRMVVYWTRRFFRLGWSLLTAARSARMRSSSTDAGS
jgi:hypothetical protein